MNTIIIIGIFTSICLIFTAVVWALHSAMIRWDKDKKMFDMIIIMGLVSWVMLTSVILFQLIRGGVSK